MADTEGPRPLVTQRRSTPLQALQSLVPDTIQVDPIPKRGRPPSFDADPKNEPNGLAEGCYRCAVHGYVAHQLPRSHASPRREWRGVTVST